LSIKLRIGKLQEELVRQFTHVEVVTLTVWLYLSLIGAAMIVLGIYLLIFEVLVPGLILLSLGLSVSILSAEILDKGLHKEHDIATESGNVGPDAQ
jgi:hypothetical protein